MLGFVRRKFTIIHNGELKRKASGGKADIEMFDDKYYIIIEVTKTTKSNADREFNSIKAHLQDIAKKYRDKECFCIYISPETFKRNMDSFSLFNRDNEEKIIPFNFINFNHFIDYVLSHDNKYFDTKGVKKLFEFQLKTTTSDADVLEFINNNIIKNPEIEAEIKKQRKLDQERNNREIESMMKKIHNMLRGKYAKNPDEAVKEVSKIVFMKMYEEDKELREPPHENRCTLKRLAEIKKTGEENPINYVFEKIKKEMKKAEPDAVIFDDNETIELEDKTITKILELMNGKSFVKLGMDIKGKIYELFLGSTMKNTALGQYFTPEEVINLVIGIADLKIKDNILDPCCGTGRFLTNAMDYLVKKVESNPEFDKNDIKNIRKKQIYGIDLSKAVFKIARMNMYIHEDGKSNILRENFIISNPSMKGKFNCILTNPPFGDINIVEDIEGIEEYEQQIIKEFPKVDIEEIEKDEKKEKHLKYKSYKGGALLIQRANCLLDKGGKLITIIDEGLLNTDEYSELREFIIKNFFIRAIISLPQMTFKRLAKSQPKASIIYLIKKDNTLDIQTEPIFFAQASKVGIDTRGKPCRNDFDLIIPEFHKFLDEINKNIEKHNDIFNKQSFDFKKFSGNTNKNYWCYEEDKELIYYITHFDNLLDRFDFVYNRPDLLERINKIKEGKYSQVFELLKDRHTRKGTTPNNPKDKKKEIPLLTIKNIQKDGTISYKDTAYISKAYFENKEKENDAEKRKEIIGLKKGDIIMAITGATIGKLAIFNDDKEVAICGDIAKITPKNTEDSIFIASFLESKLGEIQIKRVINGSTNFHLSILDIDRIIVPEIKNKEDIIKSLIKTDGIMKDLGFLIDLSKEISESKKQLIAKLLINPKGLKEYDENIEDLKESLKLIAKLRK